MCPFFAEIASSPVGSIHDSLQFIKPINGSGHQQAAEIVVADLSLGDPLVRGPGVAMRGGDEICGELFSYIDLEERVRADHPLRPIREIANAALTARSGDFAALYCGMGRSSVPPEKLLRAMLLQAFYSVRSERQLMERIEFDLLFRSFVGVGIDDACGTIPPLQRTATGCWKARSPPSSWPRYCRSRGSSGCCRASTSRWTAS
jgi:hypothetical protein